MRLVQVAKALGMTGQQLRKELSTVNFGVKPTDREIPDTLARGIIRFVAQKHGLSVNADAVLAEPQSAEDEAEMDAADAAAAPAVPAAPVSTEPRRVPEATQEQAKAYNESLNVLRKLSLDDVPKDAIRRQQQATEKLTKAQRDERSAQQRNKQPQRCLNARLACPVRSLGRECLGVADASLQSSVSVGYTTFCIRLWEARALRHQLAEVAHVLRGQTGRSRRVDKNAGHLRQWQARGFRRCGIRAEIGRAHV